MSFSKPSYLISELHYFDFILLCKTHYFKLFKTEANTNFHNGRLGVPIPDTADTKLFKQIVTSPLPNNWHTSKFIPLHR